MAAVLKDVTSKSAGEQSQELQRWKNLYKGQDLYIKKDGNKRYIVRR
jgi:hypothetical protein